MTRLASLLLAGSALVAGSALAQEAPLPQADDPWFVAGQAQLQEILALQPNTNRARNVILFVGDGLGVSTVTATRIFEGQLQGGMGEDHVLSFEAFPYLALVKTYSADGQVSDSAPTASAMHSGVKLRNGVLGVNDTVAEQDCAAALANPVTSILEIAEQRGLATGVVSTARITHATPAAAYSHTPFRDWEADNNMPAEVLAAGCTDIARQLIEFPYGDGLEVALGGGRQMFLPKDAADPEDAGQTGVRADGRDLTQEWVGDRNDAAFVCGIL